MAGALGFRRVSNGLTLAVLACIPHYLEPPGGKHLHENGRAAWLEEEAPVHYLGALDRLHLSPDAGSGLRAQRPS